METAERFETWAIVEVMGHRTFAGLVGEQTVGGASFVRVDVPATNGRPAFSKLFGAGSIYCISPCTEETARRVADGLRARSFELYALPAPAPQAAQREEEYFGD